MQTRRRAIVGTLAGAFSIAALISLPSAVATADDSPTHHHQLPPPANGTSASVCPTTVAPGQATCLSRRRTDSPATTAAPQPPGTAAPATASGTTVAATLGNSGAYDPSYLQSAYNAPTAGGSGQTVAIVDAYDDPSAASDLTSYRSFFGLPACTTSNGCFRKVNESGGSSYPQGNTGWGQEISLDLDMVSAICPNCHILLVEANSSSISDLGTAVNEAVALGANVVSNSYGGPEYNGEATSAAQYFNHPGVAITVAAGDNGYGVEFPAAANTVTAVGGTTLQQATNTGSRDAAETVWSGSGSGCSAYEAKPTWQTDTGCTKRTNNDVSAVGDPNTGVWVYDSYGGGTWGIFGGTSVATPIVGAMYALAGNAKGSSTQLNSLPYAHAGALNDVTSGTNGSCSVAYFCTGEVGYDGPTGLGTPNGVAAFSTSASTATAPSAPTNLTATGGNAVVNLTWSTPSSNGGSAINGYRIYRATSSGTETLLTSVGVTNSYSDIAVTNGTKYYYEVTALNTVGESLISTEASATPSGSTTTAPSAPTNLTATGGNAVVNLTWSTPSSNGGSAITGYRIYRGTSSGTESLLTSVGVTTSHSDTAVTNGTKYYYEVTAVNTVGPSSFSNEASATPTAPAATVPGAPLNLVAQTTGSGVGLTWSAPSSNGGATVTKYQVYRSTSSGHETFYVTVNCTSSSCSYSDTGATGRRTTYFYKVAATNIVGTGPFSNEAAARG